MLTSEEVVWRQRERFAPALIAFNEWRYLYFILGTVRWEYTTTLSSG